MQSLQGISDVDDSYRTWRGPVSLTAKGRLLSNEVFERLLLSGIRLLMQTIDRPNFAAMRREQERFSSTIQNHARSRTRSILTLAAFP